MARGTLTTLAAAVLATAAATALAVPPPWAPAHGYRYHNLDGLEIIYDRERDLWTVLTVAGLYYLQGRYWRYEHDHWEASDRHDGGWRKPREGAIPRPLHDLRADRRTAGPGQRPGAPMGRPGKPGHGKGAR